jgi:hypothetical protein
MLGLLVPGVNMGGGAVGPATPTAVQHHHRRRGHRDATTQGAGPHGLAMWPRRQPVPVLRYDAKMSNYAHLRRLGVG